MATYREQIAQMRAARQQAEADGRLDAIRQEYAEAQQLRDSATDAGTWHMHDSDCERLEAEYLRMLPPEQQQPQIPGVQQFAHRYRNFFEKYGQKALAVCALADTYATRPRNPHSTQDQNAGMGLQRGSAQYWDAIPKLLEMYGQSFGVTFDPSEAALTPDEAAALSGVDHSTYNEEVRRLYDTGHNSDALYGGWERKTG
jgi:hypothetical protein